MPRTGLSKEEIIEKVAELANEKKIIVFVSYHTYRLSWN